MALYLTMSPALQVLSIVLVAAAPGAGSSDSHLAAERMREALAVMQRPVAAVQFEHHTLREVLDWHRAQGLKNIVVHWKLVEEAGVDRNTLVTLSATNVTVERVLNLSLEAASEHVADSGHKLAYIIRDGVVRISTSADFAGEVETRVYEISALIHPVLGKDTVPRRSAGEEQEEAEGEGETSNRPRQRPDGSETDIVLTRSANRCGGGPTKRELRAAKLVSLIESLKQIHPETWQENGGPGRIRFAGHQLIITQTLEMHEIIGGHENGLQPAFNTQAAN